MRDTALLDIFILTSEDLMKLQIVRRLHMRGNRWLVLGLSVLCF